MAALLQTAAPLAVLRSLPETIHVSRLPSDQQQRYLNGPLTGYASQLSDTLPIDVWIDAQSHVRRIARPAAAPVPAPGFTRDAR